MQIHFIDVGQGDAIAIRLPDNKKILVDSGTPDSSEDLIKYLNDKFFKSEEEYEFDIFVITHPHQDHIGGAIEIFRQFQVNNFYRPHVYLQTETYTGDGFVYQSDMYELLIRQVSDEPNCQMLFFEQDTQISGENYKFQFFMQSELVSNLNNFSPLILFECYNKRIVLTGDLESDAEDQILTAYKDILQDIDLLKVGHHGSTTSSSVDFITCLSPTYSVISVGRFNEYNHPSQTTLDTLQASGSKVYRTDNNGNIIFSIYNGNLIYIYDFNNRLPIRLQLWYFVLPSCVVSLTLLWTINIKRKV